MFEQLQGQFRDPASEYRSAPFWSWNAAMDPDEIRSQIREFHKAGIGGFFMHSRGGLETPFLSEAWFAACDAAIDEARKLGMLAWAYDEDRWPSGAAGGITTGRFPETAALVLEAVPEEAAPTLQAGLIACFCRTKGGWQHMKDVPADGRGGKYLVFYEHASRGSDWYNGRPPLDVASRQAVRRFIEVAYKPYVDRYPSDLGKAMPGVFTDEPNFFAGGRGQAEKGTVVPWTRDLLKEFRKRRGYDLAAYLPALINEKLDAARGADEVRVDFWQTMTELFVENFSAQIGRFCAKHGIALTGHYLSEETLMSQAVVGGAVMPHYVHEQLPGIDILCRRTNELLTVKQTASVARQWGRNRLISELYGASGWDLSLQDQKWIGDWQYALGVNYRCQHLCLFTLCGERKRDYPPSHMPHQPWWRHYRMVEDYFARVSLALSVGEPLREVAVLHPIRSAWAALARPLPGGKAPAFGLDAQLRDLLDTLLYAQIDLDFIDEMLLAGHGGVKGNRVFVNKSDYRIVVVPEVTHLAASTARVLLEAAKKGVHVLFAGAKPAVKVYDPKAPARALADLSRKVNGLLAASKVSPKALPRKLRSLMVEPVVVEPAARVLYQLRASGDERLLFLTNQTDQPAEVTIHVTGGQDLSLWCAETGKRSAWPYERTRGGARFRVSLAQAGSALFGYLATAPAEPQLREAPPPPAMGPVPLTEPLTYLLDRPNVLLLDRASLRVEGAGVALEGFVPQIGREVRAIFGYPDNRYSAKQPWAWEHRPPSGRQVAVTYSFEVAEVPAGAVFLAVEQPRRKRIFLNGQPAEARPDGFYLDPAFVMVALPPLEAGLNYIEIREDLDMDFETEAIYLLGSFGVRDRRVVRAPEALHPDDWTAQGLPYFAGTVTYLVPVDVDEAGAYAVEVDAQGVVTIGVGAEGQDRTYRAFAPWRFRIDLQKGRNVLAVEMANSLRNLMGPHHCKDERPMWVGPTELAPSDPVDRYVHIPSGLVAVRMAKVV